MGKNKLSHEEIQAIINDYQQAYRMVYWGGAINPIVSYRKGWFYQGKIPYRAKEIQAMTARLKHYLPQRADSDDDGEPD